MCTVLSFKLFLSSVGYSPRRVNVGQNTGSVKSYLAFFSLLALLLLPDGAWDSLLSSLIDCNRTDILLRFISNSWYNWYQNMAQIGVVKSESSRIVSFQTSGRCEDLVWLTWVKFGIKLISFSYKAYHSVHFVKF